MAKLALLVPSFSAGGLAELRADWAVVVTGSASSGGGSGKAYSSRRLRKDVDDWLERERLRELAEQIRREDEELVVILTALAA